MNPVAPMRLAGPPDKSGVPAVVPGGAFFYFYLA
jgi:hypothetical protein